MKRFKQLIVHCQDEQQAQALMEKIGAACNKSPFLFKEKIAKRFPNENDIMQIIATVKNMAQV